MANAGCRAETRKADDNIEGLCLSQGKYFIWQVIVANLATQLDLKL